MESKIAGERNDHARIMWRTEGIAGHFAAHWVESAALSSISGQVYVATNDAMIYAFGTSMGR